MASMTYPDEIAVQAPSALSVIAKPAASLVKLTSDGSAAAPNVPAQPDNLTQRSEHNAFLSTHWSLVFSAARDGIQSEAMNLLCQKYWKPIYVFIRRSRWDATEAEDITQEFLVYFIERSWIQQADPERGKFRALLLTVLRNFLSNYRRRGSRQKRGGGAAIVYLDANETATVESLASSTLSPAQAFDEAWARDVLASALRTLRAEQTDRASYAVLEPFLINAPGAGDYERIATQLGTRRGQVAKLIHRLSRRFAELARAEVAGTVSSPQLVSEELQHLRAALHG